VSRIPVSSPDAPAPVGPCSQAIASGDHLFLSGQTPIDPATGSLIGGDVGAQAQRCFDNLAAGGLSFDDVVKVSVYLTSMDDFQVINLSFRTSGRLFLPPSFGLLGGSDRQGFELAHELV